MKRWYTVTFTGFTGAQHVEWLQAYSADELRDLCEPHMCSGDLLTIEETR